MKGKTCFSTAFPCNHYMPVHFIPMQRFLGFYAVYIRPVPPVNALSLFPLPPHLFFATPAG